jgi:tetratricopeptide (TPR) repeat protein
LGQCEFYEKNYLAATQSFESVLRLSPGQTEAATMRGASLAMSGRTAEALEQFRSVIKEHPEFQPPYRMLGMFEVQSGNTGPEARAALEKALDLEPSDVRADYWLGELLLAQNDFEGALAQFNATLKANPDGEQALIGRGTALRALGKAQAALTDFDRVLEVDPQSAKALLGAAQCEYDLRNIDGALKHGEAAHAHAIDLADKRASAWLLARLFRFRHEDARAVEYEQEVIRLEQQANAQLAEFRRLQEAAAAYRKAGDFAKVAETLERAISIEERQDSFVVLGDAYVKLGRPKDALSCYLKALNAGPDAPEIRERLRRTRTLLDANR